MNKNKLILAISCFIFAVCVITSCVKDVGKVPVEPTKPVISSCDTITYTKHIKPITDTKCAISGCHDGSNANPVLNNYAVVKDRAERIKIRAVDANPFPMPPPPNPALTAAEKQLINCWIENGKKE